MKKVDSKLYTILVCMLFWHSNTVALEVAIIESQSILNETQDMDEKWERVVKQLGHAPTILPQDYLESVEKLAGYDLLIIASGEIPLTGKGVQTIIDFLSSGRPVYLQSEYYAENSTNTAFVEIVESLGGEFEWEKEFVGSLDDIEVLGTFKTNPNSTMNVQSFWYSVSGIGDCRSVPFLRYAGKFHGFHYYPLNNSFGTIITTSDQDWVRENLNPKLLENIFWHLIEPPALALSDVNVNLGTDTFLCIGDTILLDASIPEGISYTWQDNSTNSTFEAFESGLYSVVIDSYCGKTNDQIQLVFVEEPSFEFCCDFNLCEGESILLNASSEGSTYQWNNGSTDPIHEIDLPGSYYVIIQNACNVDTVFAEFFLEDCTCDIVVPNIFSPNGDNINDLLPVESTCDLLNYELMIFDRWGNLVFKSLDQNDQWNGYLVDRQLPAGVYAFYLKYRSGRDNKIKYGDITLIR